MFAPPRDPGARPPNPNLLLLDRPPCTIPPRSLRLLSGQEGTQQHIRIMQGTTKPSKPSGMTMLEMRLFLLSKSSMFEFHLLSRSLLSSSWPLFICSTWRSNSSCLLLTSLSKSAKGSRFWFSLEIHTDWSRSPNLLTLVPSPPEFWKIVFCFSRLEADVVSKNANVTKTMKTGEVKIAPVPPMSLQHSAVSMQIYALIHQQFGKGGPAAISQAKLRGKV